MAKARGALASIASAVGSTPVLRLSRLEAKHGLKAQLYAKLESVNPLGSVKDRIANALIDELIKTRQLKANGVIIEATSGNTGVALASAAASRGLSCIVVVPEGASAERRSMLDLLGARLVFAGRGIKDAIKRAKVLQARIEGSALANQFESPANSKAHKRTTAKEIMRQLARVDYLVAGVGTGGTITGVGEALKRKRPATNVVAVEPWRSPVLSGGRPGAHTIQGIGAGFVPSALNISVIDLVFKAKDWEAVAYARDMAATEGVAVGLSAGAALCAGVSLARAVNDSSKTVLVILPSLAERYMSTELFKLEADSA
ncbi:putative cysteine synthase A [Candidatus Hodgkinia cicadicola Dsem]|nr:putative cysteine synthase A [Candidatus Hodgkinia cicadicola Dsem]